MRKKHPKELYILALSELCERFAFWGIGFLLVLYLVEYYQVEDAKATTIYGIFAGCATFLPLIGGMIADRWNYQAPLFLGALINAIGCFLLSLGSEFLLYPSLAIIALGYGLFTPSILTFLGYSYRKEPDLREAGFSLYYASINIGVFLSLVTLGYIAQKISWNAAFLTAGIVQMGGLIPISWFLIEHRAMHQELQHLQETTEGQKQPLIKKDRDRIKVIVAIGLFSVLFWIAFNQGYSSMSLFAKNYTNRFVFNWKVPPSWILSSESFFLIVLAPILAWAYALLQRKKIDPSPFTKTALGLILLSSCFGMMMLASSRIPLDARSASIPALYPICAYFLMALGEMLLAPIGLSLISKLAPRRLTGFFIGFWYLCLGLASYIGGMLASLMDKFEHLYDFFGLFVILTLIPGVILLFLIQKLIKLSH